MIRGHFLGKEAAINCPKKKAYEHMMATKQRFGKLGGNVGYHGYQSFMTGEVTPEEAHRIGMETARRMWGDEYEIVVTTHLNTDNLHNHFIVNSVSFKTGRKFENHISDHHRLRDISDAVCMERGKSVLVDAPLQTPIPLTPKVRAEARRFDQWDRQQRFLMRNEIHSPEELVLYMDKADARIREMEQERNYISNLIRRPKDAEDLERNKALRHELSGRMKPLRDELKVAQQTFASIPRVKELIETERQHELAIREKQKERVYER